MIKKGKGMISIKYKIESIGNKGDLWPPTFWKTLELMICITNLKIVNAIPSILLIFNVHTTSVL